MFLDLLLFLLCRHEEGEPFSSLSSTDLKTLPITREQDDSESNKVMDAAILVTYKNQSACKVFWYKTWLQVMIVTSHEELTKKLVRIIIFDRGCDLMLMFGLDREPSNF